MSYSSFRIIAISLGIFVLLLMGYCTKRVLFSDSSDTKTTVTAQPVQAQPVQQPVQTSANNTQVTSTEQTRSVIEQWLTKNPDRQGKNRIVDILPNQSFRATAIRFPDSDAVKWSNDNSQWSQIKLDMNRDGVDDEKWLLKNGHTYKREIIDPSGKTTRTDYFK